jgi:hypothetical protein
MDGHDPRHPDSWIRLQHLHSEDGSARACRLEVAELIDRRDVGERLAAFRSLVWVLVLLSSALCFPPLPIQQLQSRLRCS